MNIVVLIGGRAGTVQDVPVEHARAMVADGRARWPEGSPHASPDAQADGAGEPEGQEASQDSQDTRVAAVLAQVAVPTVAVPVATRVAQVGHVPREKHRGRR